MIRARRLRLPAALGCLTVAFACTASFASTDIPTDWQRSVLENLRQAEYRFSEVEDGLWSAPNRSHDLRTYVSEAGLRLVPRRSVANSWDVEFRLHAPNQTTVEVKVVDAQVKKLSVSPVSRRKDVEIYQERQ